MRSPRWSPAGHRRITIAPLFMAQGGHFSSDLPKLLDAIRADASPASTFTVLPAVGDVEPILECYRRLAGRRAAALTR